MEYKALLSHLRKNGERIKESIRNQTYKPMPVKRVEIPKEDGSKRTLFHALFPFLFVSSEHSVPMYPFRLVYYQDSQLGFTPTD